MRQRLHHVSRRPAAHVLAVDRQHSHARPQAADAARLLPGDEPRHAHGLPLWVARNTLLAELNPERPVTWMHPERLWSEREKHACTDAQRRAVCGPNFATTERVGVVERALGLRGGVVARCGALFCIQLLTSAVLSAAGSGAKPLHAAAPVCERIVRHP